MNGVGSKNSRLQPGSAGVPQTIALPFTTLTYRGDPSALRKSKATGTIGASRVRCSAVCRRVPERIEKPRAVGRSARSESRSGIHATEVGNRIDARDARQRRLLCSVQPRSCAVDARELQVEVSRECSGDLIGSRGLLRLRSAGDSKAPAKAECFGVFTGPGTEAPLRTV
jgi:hypothetical protein